MYLCRQNSFNIKRWFIFGIVAALFFGCKKKAAPVNNENTNGSNVKVSLTTDNAMIRLGQESVVTAYIEGAQGSITYQWEVNTISNILGTGNTVTLSPCCSSVAGENIVKCTATDAKGNRGVGQITIIVNP